MERTPWLVHVFLSLIWLTVIFRDVCHDICVLCRSLPILHKQCMNTLKECNVIYLLFFLKGFGDTSQESTRLENFTYSDREVLDEIFRHIKSTSFNGVTVSG